VPTGAVSRSRMKLVAARTMMLCEYPNGICSHATPFKSDFVLKERTGGAFSGSHAGLTFSYPGLTGRDSDRRLRRNMA
jgi:hypothetical protein